MPKIEFEFEEFNAVHKEGRIMADVNGMNIGDIITTYHKGYWRLVGIKRRFYTESDLRFASVLKNKKIGDEYSPLFTYEHMMTADFKPVKKVKSRQTKVCDASYCKKVTKEQVDALLKKYTEGINNLLELIKK